MTDGLGHQAAELYTVLLTDIEDSTRLWEHDPHCMETVVIDHTEVVTAVVNEHHGLPIKSTGDGMLALFPDAADAVAAAVDMQRLLWARRWPGIGQVHVRIGLNTGMCKLANGDVLGRPPNLAARLQSAGHGDQILLSGATARACSGRLRPGEELFDLGQYLMRGFDGPVEVHTVVADGLPAVFPPLRAAYSGFDELPLDDAELFGRDDTISDTLRLLHEHRLVTLWGPGGVGKTRLAVRVATTARRPYEDGVRFVDLTAITDPKRVSDVVVAALRAQPLGGEDSADTVLRALRAMRVLLVLDNCEHVLSGVRSVVSGVLQACPDAHVLATSREPLGIRAECTVELRTLPLPPEVHVSVSELAQSPSVQLFVTCVAASQPGFALSDENAAAVASICRAADGLPLALELAAARAGIEGMGLAYPRMNDADARHGGARLDESLLRTLTGLTDDQAYFFSRLAVFSGTFSRELALAMAPNPRHDDADLDRLIRTALVQKDSDASGHYRLLAPARHFAWARLDEDGQISAGWAHARTMLERAEAREPLLRTDQQAAAVAGSRAEFAEYRAAMSFFLDRDAVPEAARLLIAVFQFCLVQPRPEGHRWARAVADRLTGDELYSAEVIGAAALGLWFEGDTDAAVGYGLRAVAAAEATGQSARWARTALVDAFAYAGDLEAVGPHFGAMVEGLRASDDPYWQINGLGFEAISFVMFGRTDAALDRAERALALARRLGNPDGRHWGLYALGRVLAPTDPLGACEAFEQAMRAAREVDSGFYAGLDLVEWVALKRQLGDRPMAVAGTLDLLDLLAVSGNRSQLSQALHEAGLLLAAAERHEPAALALLARRGLPAMPTGPVTHASDRSALTELENQLSDRWPRLRVKAQALTEPELIALCRSELAELHAGWPPSPVG